MAKAVAFTPESAQRIINATRKVERMPRDMAGDRNSAGPQATSFWAYLSSAGGPRGIHWSWVRVTPVEKAPTADAGPIDLSEDLPLWEFAQPMTVGYLNAREANGNRQVPPESVVLLTFSGYHADGEPLYIFQFAGGPPEDRTIPVHDHRDADHGGFAFSVFHPGTDLPAQRFAV